MKSFLRLLLTFLPRLRVRLLASIVRMGLVLNCVILMHSRLFFVQSELAWGRSLFRVLQGCGKMSDKVVRLNRSLCGLCQAGRTWHNHLPQGCGKISGIDIVHRNRSLCGLRDASRTWDKHLVVRMKSLRVWRGCLAHSMYVHAFDASSRKGVYTSGRCSTCTRYFHRRTKNNRCEDSTAWCIGEL